MDSGFSPITGKVAGVPFVAIPPASPAAPVIIAWHLMDPPRSEAAFAAALPLAGLDAWKIYLGLPMTGSRLPDGGFDALMQLGYDDPVLKMLGPIVEQGATEFPAVYAELRERFDIGDSPLGVMGGSIGSAIAQHVILDTAPGAGIRVSAAVLVSPVTQFRQTVEANGRRFGVDYTWNDESNAIADRLDFVARAGEFAAQDEPAILLVVGADDDRQGFIDPAHRLADALRGRYRDASRVDVSDIPGLEHALTDEPGIEPAPQTDNARTVDAHASQWFAMWLTPDGTSRTGG